MWFRRFSIVLFWSLIYGFYFPIWYLLTFLHVIDLILDILKTFYVIITYHTSVDWFLVIWSILWRWMCCSVISVVEIIRRYNRHWSCTTDMFQWFVSTTFKSPGLPYHNKQTPQCTDAATYRCYGYFTVNVTYAVFIVIKLFWNHSNEEN
jgi:hypothetical protein